MRNPNVRVRSKQANEINLVERLLGQLGIIPDGHLMPRDRPDVVMHVGGHWIGIEVTVLHPDASTSNRGSPLRCQEECSTRNPSTPVVGMFITADPSPALNDIIRDKVCKAMTYQRPEGGKLWLLVACAIPGIGRGGSTYVLPGRLADVLPNSSSVLKNSRFARVYVHAIMNNEVWEWTQDSDWVQLSEGQASTARTSRPYSSADDVDDMKYTEALLQTQCNDETVLDAQIQKALADIRQPVK